MKKIAPKHINLKKPIAVYALLLLFICLSCATKHNIDNKDVAIESNPKLIFLNYTISENQNSEKSVMFIDKKIVDGKLRNQGHKYLESGKTGDLVSEQLDKNKKVLHKQTIANPLLKHIEVATDSFTFKKQMITIKQKSLNLRLQLHGKTKFIRLTEVIDSLGNTKPMITTSLD